MHISFSSCFYRLLVQMLAAGVSVPVAVLDSVCVDLSLARTDFSRLSTASSKLDRL